MSEETKNVMVSICRLSELEQVIAASGRRPILLDFSATWCGPCRVLAPILDTMTTEYPGVSFFKIDADESEGELMSQFQVQALPTVIIMVDRTVVFTMVGAKVGELRTALASLKI